MSNSVEQAVLALQKGEIIILVDDKDRENEGDFVQAAQKISPASVNFMISEGRGLLCCALSHDIAQKLDLERQAAKNTSLHGTAFTISVDAVQNTTTGVSAYDRSRTFEVLADAQARPEDLARPGHVFPIVAHEGGVLARAGHTEASVDLAKIAGQRPAVAICEVLNTEGRAANLDELEKSAKKHNLVLLHIEQLLEHVRTKGYGL